MNFTPNQNYNVIKGLQIFINDIRECTTKEAEAKRVDKELDKVRKKLSTKNALTGYEKKKCIWKLLYIHILGYKIDFGLNYSCDLITSIKYSEKMAGYIAMSILFKDSNADVEVMINSIKNDLFNKNAFSQSMALTLACNLDSPELLDSFADPVFEIIDNYKERSPYIIKKALVTLGKIFKVKKDFHDSKRLAKNLIKMIDIQNFEILISITELLLNIINMYGTKGYEDVIVKLIKEVIPCFIEKQRNIPEDYIYYHIKCPWLQIKVLKVLELCNPNIFNDSCIDLLTEYIEFYGKKTQNIVTEFKRFQRFYTEYCIFFELINLIDHLNLKLNYKIFDSYVNILGSFLIDDSRRCPNADINTRYLALDGMAKLSKYSNGNKIMKDHSTIILQSLRDSDVSIRRRALDLLFLICTPETVKNICKELLIYFREDDPQLKEDITLKIAILSEKFAPDYLWYIDCCLKMLEVAGDYAPEDIIYRIVQMVAGFENKESDQNLQIHACEKCLALLTKNYTYECVVRLSALLFGEYANLLVKKSNDNNTLVKLADLLWKHTSVCKKTTLYSILDCMIKFVNFDENFRDYAIPRFEQYLESWDTQLQQRAIEYIILSKRDNEDNEIPNMKEIRNKVVGRMPLYPASFFNNSILMKKLQKNSPKNYIDNKTFVSKGGEKSNGDESDIDYKNSEIYQKDPNGFANEMNKNPNDVKKIEKNNISNFDMFKSMLTSTNSQGGVIYSDQNSIKVSLMIKKLGKGSLGYIFAFTPYASGNEKIENIVFQVANYNSNDLLNISISKVKYDNVPQLMMKIQINEVFDEPPLINLSCNLGNRQINCQFSIPCLVTKFLSPFETSIENYSQLYLECTNSTSDNYGRLDAVMYNPMSGNKNIMDFLKKMGLLMQNLSFKVFAPENKSNFHDIEGCANFESGQTSVPVLFQASFVPSVTGEFRFSLRSKHSNSHQFVNLLPAIFSVVKMWVNPS